MKDKIRAKFHVNEVADLDYGQGCKGAERVNASAVYSSTGESADFSKASPSGDFASYFGFSWVAPAEAAPEAQ